MSKRFLKLFALIAVFTLVMAGSAFAATAVERSWKQGVMTGDWTSPSNWTGNQVPTSTDIAVFTTNVSQVNIPADSGLVEVGGIRTSTAADNVVFSVGANSTLQISGDVRTVANLPIAQFQIEGSAKFIGGGAVELTAFAPRGGISFDVSSAKTLDFGVIVSSDATVPLLEKLGKGTLAFTSGANNQFYQVGTMGDTRFDILDGELAIARAGHINTNVQVRFNTHSIQGTSATLTFTGTGSFTELNKVDAITDGTMNLAGVDFSLNGTGTGTAAAPQNVPVVTGSASTVVTKKGTGQLNLISTGVWGVSTGTAARVMRPALTIAEANVLLGSAPNVLSCDLNLSPTASTVPVSVADGARLIVNNTYVQNVNTFGGMGTLEVREGSWFVINATSTVPGLITGTGSIQVGNSDVTSADARVYLRDDDALIPTITMPTVTISGKTNNYTGDTRVTVGSILVISHEKNLGGTTLGKLYLEPQRGYGVLTYPALPANRGATLQIAEVQPGQGFTFILPNEIYIGEGVKSITTTPINTFGADVLRNTGEVEIFVPINGRLEVANNVTFNANVLGKIGEGAIVFSSLGYDSIGGNSFVTSVGTTGAANSRRINSNPPMVSTALHLWNGLTRIENANVAGTGDIVVDTGGFPAGRPILSIRNGLVMSNSIRFTDQASFATELIDANLAQGTSVQSAVEVGHVSCVDSTNRVYNRVNFSDLTGGTIHKGDDFQLMKATTYTNYAAPQVTPAYWDGQLKAPFDPYFSNVFLYFKATHNIDVPVFGTPSITSAAPGSAFSVTIPVTSTTGLKAGSATVNPASFATILINGNNLILTGTASATEQVVPYRVSVTTQGDVATSMLEFSGLKDLTLTVTSADIPDPTKPTLTPVSSAAPSTVKQGNEVVFTVDWSYKDASGTIDVAPASMVLSDIALAGPATLVDDSLATDGTYTVLVNADATNGQTVSLSLKGAYAGLTTPASVSATVNDGVVPPTPTNGGSSGCDVGFAGLALLLAAPLFLRKKD